MCIRDSYEGTWEKFHNGGQNTERTKDLLNTAAQAAHDVMAGGAFELFAPQDVYKRQNLGLYRYDKKSTIVPYTFVDGLPSSVFITCCPVIDCLLYTSYRSGSGQY